MKRRDTYHHGELRSALIAAALALLEREGPQALSLRRLAREAGVSAMAPYHHFANRNDLMAAVAQEGFCQLQQEKAGLVALSDSDPAGALVAGTVGYVDFVLARPNLYRLMKGPEFTGPDIHPDLAAAMAAPAASLLAMIRRACPAIDKQAAIARGKVLWALAHGLAILALDRQIDPQEARDLAQQGAATLISAWIG